MSRFVEVFLGDGFVIWVNYIDYQTTLQGFLNGSSVPETMSVVSRPAPMKSHLKKVATPSVAIMPLKSEVLSTGWTARKPAAATRTAEVAMVRYPRRDAPFRPTRSGRKTRT